MRCIPIIYLFVYLPINEPTSQPIYSTTYPSIYLLTYTSKCPFICTFTCPSINQLPCLYKSLLIRLSIYLPKHSTFPLFIDLLIYLSTCSSIYLSLYLPIHQSSTHYPFYSLTSNNYSSIPINISQLLYLFSPLPYYIFIHQSLSLCIPSSIHPRTYLWLYLFGLRTTSSIYRNHKTLFDGNKTQ